MTHMPEFLQFAFSGLTVGAVYALVALGFTLIYNASDVINFAQGEFVMLGGMVTVFLALRRRAAAARGAASPSSSTVVVGLALYRFAIEPARGASAVVAHHHHHRRLDLPARRRAGRLRQALPQPAALVRRRSHPFVGGAAILPQSLVVLAGAGVIVVLLWAFIDAHAARQGDCRDRRQPARRAPGRHQHRAASSGSSFAIRRRSARSPAS